MDNQININDVAKCLNDFVGLALPEYNTVSLLKRRDKKFIFNIQKLPEFLKEFAGMGFHVLQIDGDRLLEYNTHYFDTDFYYVL